MRIGVPRETRSDERRIAAVPETVKKLVAKGAEVLVEAGAGESSSFPDDAFTRAGARIVDGDEAWGAELVFKVQPPSAEEARRLSEGAILVTFLYPEANPEAVEALIQRGATVLAMESVPRIARAQKMDALSSMANIAGYKAILEASNEFGRYFPLLMTAAGTIPPAQVLVIGAGVAGLSAIVTAKRLGAVVRAFDPRPAVAEQVESLGARFLALELEAAEETEGGYAGMQSEEFLEKERELLAAHLDEIDVVVSAALIRGRAAPVLITREMLSSMAPGSVVVDLAVEQGGNCEASVAGEVVEVDGVTVIGHTNWASRVPIHGSLLYARNVYNLVDQMWGEDGFEIDLSDDVTTAVAVLHRGEDRREAAESGAVPAGETSIPPSKES